MNGSGSNWRPGWRTRAGSTSSTNPPPVCISRTSKICSGCWIAWSTRGSPSSSSSTTRPSWRTPTGSSISDPGAGHDGGRVVFEGAPAELVAGPIHPDRGASRGVRRGLRGPRFPLLLANRLPGLPVKTYGRRKRQRSAQRSTAGQDREEQVMGEVVPFGRKPARSGQRRTRPLAPGGPPASRSRTGSPDIARLPDLDIPVQDRRFPQGGPQPRSGTVVAQRHRRRARRRAPSPAADAGAGGHAGGHVGPVPFGAGTGPQGGVLRDAGGRLWSTRVESGRFRHPVRRIARTAAGRPGGPTLLAA